MQVSLFFDQISKLPEFIFQPEGQDGLPGCWLRLLTVQLLLARLEKGHFQAPKWRYSGTILANCMVRLCGLVGFWGKLIERICDINARCPCLALLRRVFYGIPRRVASDNSPKGLPA
jgi:hypothetical protein